MSEKVLKFLLSELSVVRIVCQGKRGTGICGAVVEVPVNQLETMYNQVHQCPICKTAWGVHPSGTGGASPDGFGPLGEAIRNLNAARDRVQVEFVLPDKE